jgi:hypothetical protein
LSHSLTRRSHVTISDFASSHYSDVTTAFNPAEPTTDDGDGCAMLVDEAADPLSSVPSEPDPPAKRSRIRSAKGAAADAEQAERLGRRRAREVSLAQAQTTLFGHGAAEYESDEVVPQGQEINARQKASPLLRGRRAASSSSLGRHRFKRRRESHRATRLPLRLRGGDWVYEGLEEEGGGREARFARQDCGSQNSWR